MAGSQVNAFVPQQRQSTTTTTTTALEATWQQQVHKTVATALVTASLWTAPAFLASSSNNGMMTPLTQSTTAVAKEMASGSGSRVNKDPESLLRLGLPINNKEVRSFVCVCVCIDWFMCVV